MSSPLTPTSFGPFDKGVISTGNPALNLKGALRRARGMYYDGIGRFVTRLGTQVVLTLKDDAGSPANVTSVCGCGHYKDRAWAVAHSTDTDKAYLYVLTPTMDGWYDSTGALQSDATPEPVAVLWTGITVAPDVTVAEELGYLVVAHAQAADASGLYFATRQWDGAYPVTLTNLKASGVGGIVGTDDAYFLGVVGFQQHLWGWGYGSGATGAAGYRPELARYSQPNFGPLQTADSITIGSRVRSEREKIIAGAAVGKALFLASAYLITRVTGTGRSSWYKDPVDEPVGLVGPKAHVAAGDSYWYFWSQRGPARISPSGPVEPLWDQIADLVRRVVNPEKIVASREEAQDLVIFTVDTGTGIRTRCAYDVRREVWLGPDDDYGIVIRAAGEVDEVKVSTAAGVAPPSGPPTTASTDFIGQTTARANWVNGDATAETQIEYRIQGTSTWNVVTSLAPGITSYTFSGLTADTSYEWRAVHQKAGQFSAYLGPVAGSQFTTVGLVAPTNLAAEELILTQLYVSWTNSGESGVSTEIEVDDPVAAVFSLKATASPGESSKVVSISRGVGSYDVRIRHVKGGVTPSAYAGPVTAVVT